MVRARSQHDHSTVTARPQHGHSTATVTSQGPTPLTLTGPALFWRSNSAITPASSVRIVAVLARRNVGHAAAAAAAAAAAQKKEEKKKKKKKKRVTVSDQRSERSERSVRQPAECHTEWRGRKRAESRAPGAVCLVVQEAEEKKKRREEKKKRREEKRKRGEKREKEPIRVLVNQIE